eukprot:SAG11_NODE_26656_length_342_cov_1.251029_2_plen_39_part_01
MLFWFTCDFFFFFDYPVALDFIIDIIEIARTSHQRVGPH